MMGIERLVFRRLLQSIPTVLGVVVLNFILLHLLPGDIVDALTANAPSAGVDFKAELRAEMGLDKPVWLQFLIYMGNILRFDFGYSYTNSLPVVDVIWGRLGATLVLMLSSIL